MIPSAFLAEGIIERHPIAHSAGPDLFWGQLCVLLGGATSTLVGDASRPLEVLAGVKSLKRGGIIFPVVKNLPPF